MTTLEHTIWALSFLALVYLIGRDLGKRRGIELTITFLKENNLLKEDIEDDE